MNGKADRLVGTAPPEETFYWLQKCLGLPLWQVGKLSNPGTSAPPHLTFTSHFSPITSRPARRLRRSLLATTIAPPRTDQGAGISALSNITQIGFKTGSMIPMSEAFRARTCRMAAE